MQCVYLPKYHHLTFRGRGSEGISPLLPHTPDSQQIALDPSCTETSGINGAYSQEMTLVTLIEVPKASAEPVKTSDDEV
jgi:hypothetical protein